MLRNASFIWSKTTIEVSLLIREMNFGVRVVFGMTNMDNINKSNSYNGAGRYKIGPFVGMNRVSLDEMKLIDYMMNEYLDDWCCK